MPFLDNSVVEFALRTPSTLKLKGNLRKYPIRNILYKYVPREIIDRPKSGFQLPIDTWLSHELRDWAKSLLKPTKILNEGLLNYQIVRRAWDQHLSGSHV